MVLLRRYCRTGVDLPTCGLEVGEPDPLFRLQGTPERSVARHRRANRNGRVADGGRKVSERLHLTGKLLREWPKPGARLPGFEQLVHLTRPQVS